MSSGHDYREAVEVRMMRIAVGYFTDYAAATPLAGLAGAQ
jgi:hypothetical protein